jgi:hypothetical protein
MKLTILLSKCHDGRWKSSLVELPHVFYFAQTAEGAENKMERLVKALASPHIQLESVRDDGDGIVLTIARDPADREAAVSEDGAAA